MNMIEKSSAAAMDNRITAQEREFCRAHQSAYAAAKQALANLRQVQLAMYDQQKELLPAENHHKCIYISLPGQDGFIIGEKMEAANEEFIRQIVDYFTRIYRVTIPFAQIVENLIPDKPQNAEWRINADKTRQYHQNLQELMLDYHDILHAIFLQFGGRSFYEQALAELKEKCRNAVLDYPGGVTYRLNGDTIIFSPFACDYEEYNGRVKRTLSDWMKEVMRGLAHFETGAFDRCPRDLEKFFASFHLPEWEYVMPSCSKVCRLVMFRDYHLDLQFRSKALARQFVDEYLSRVC